MQPNCEKTINILAELNKYYNKSKLEAFKLLNNFVKANLIQFQKETFSTLVPEQISFKNNQVIEVNQHKNKNC